MSVKRESIERGIKKVREMVEAAIQRKGDQPFVSTHESLGHMTEEYTEMIQAVRANDPHKFIKETADLCVASFWSLVSCMEVFEPQMAEVHDIFTRGGAK